MEIEMSKEQHPDPLAASDPATIPDPVAIHGRAKRRFDWKTMLGRRGSDTHISAKPKREDVSESEDYIEESKPPTWNMFMLNDRLTEHVPGTVLLLSRANEYNEPLGMENAPARTSASSLPPISRRSNSISSVRRTKKKTPDGKFILDPQPDDTLNDPLNWKVWRRDAALLSLGFYCMLGGGMTPVLAAGFNNVAATFNVSEASVALTTGLYMLGLGIGSVLLSPTAILFGKRPVYLVAALCFALSGVWCALSESFGSLIAGRIFMGIAVSSGECLPSSSIAEIYFLHEKAYRLGIYTLLLLGGKNLVPLVSAAIIESLGWRWVFWAVAIIVAFSWFLLFFFVPETFWDRTPRPNRRSRTRRILSTGSLQHVWKSASQPTSPSELKRTQSGGGADEGEPAGEEAKSPVRRARFQDADMSPAGQGEHKEKPVPKQDPETTEPLESHKKVPRTPAVDVEKASTQNYFSNQNISPSSLEAHRSGMNTPLSRTSHDSKPSNPYTRALFSQPPKTSVQQLKPYAGRLTHDNWFKVALRPFILFAYPAILWSALVYSLSIGWLIVLSESITQIYKSRDTYNFTSLQAGLVYVSPFIGGILGTAIAGKVSDLIVRWLARKNGGLYEPEFRLVMVIPIALSTVIGLMGYGWSAQNHDAWIVPTVFFGIISFGCSLGSTTSITFAVDSYRQYAGEALVTLNFSKNVLHGMVFSFFFNNWLEKDGSKEVFLIVGGIQLACLCATVPMYIYGKRARMWTARRGLVERF